MDPIGIVSNKGMQVTLVTDQDGLRHKLEAEIQELYCEYLRDDCVAHQHKGLLLESGKVE